MKPEWTEAQRRAANAHEIGRSHRSSNGIRVESERPTVPPSLQCFKEYPARHRQTVVYIAKMQNRWKGTINKSDLEADSPYNTRKYGGLPPGPISSGSESADRPPH